MHVDELPNIEGTLWTDDSVYSLTGYVKINEVFTDLEDEFGIQKKKAQGLISKQMNYDVISMNIYSS